MTNQSTPTRVARHTRTRAGFSLIELVASMAVLAVLLAAVGSTVLLASRSVPAEGSAVTHSVRASRVLGQIAAELETAIQVNELDADDIEFVVADRDGDGDDEVIRYRWDGAGKPLTRRYNSGEDTTILDAVESLTCSVSVTEATDNADAPLIEGPEQIILAQTQSNTGVGVAYAIGAGVRLAQKFSVSIDGASAWRPTRAAFCMTKDNKAKGVVNAVLRTADAGAPGSTVIDSAQINEADMGSQTWYFVNFSVWDTYPTAEDYFVALEFVSDSVAGQAWVGMAASGGFFHDTGTGSWSASNGGMWVYVWGKPMIEDPNWEGDSIDVVDRVVLSLGIEGDGVVSTARTAVTLLNQPEAP